MAKVMVVDDAVSDSKLMESILRAAGHQVVCYGNGEGLEEKVVTERPDAILVPEEALVPFGAEKHVFRVVDGKAVDTRVKIGARRDGSVHIIEGVADGELVVTAGQLKIRDGAPVMPMPPGGAPGGGGPPGGKTSPGPGAGVPSPAPQNAGERPQGTGDNKQ